MANFNFEEFKKTRVAKTKLGAKAKFICETRGQMLVEITPLTGTSYTAKYNVNGKRYGSGEHFEDLLN